MWEYALNKRNISVKTYLSSTRTELTEQNYLPNHFLSICKDCLIEDNSLASSPEGPVVMGSLSLSDCLKKLTSALSSTKRNLGIKDRSWKIKYNWYKVLKKKKRLYPICISTWGQEIFFLDLNDLIQLGYNLFRTFCVYQITQQASSIHFAHHVPCR